MNDTNQIQIHNSIHSLYAESPKQWISYFRSAYNKAVYTTGLESNTINSTGLESNTINWCDYVTRLRLVP
mgnify:CR=1 FL=1